MDAAVFVEHRFGIRAQRQDCDVFFARKSHGGIEQAAADALAFKRLVHIGVVDDKHGFARPSVSHFTGWFALCLREKSAVFAIVLLGDVHDRSFLKNK